MGAAPRETCLECFDVLTATQQAALNQALLAQVGFEFNSIDSFCEQWQYLTQAEKDGFDFLEFEEIMAHVGIPLSTASSILHCVLGSVG